jgi:hypothetical protein
VEAFFYAARTLLTDCVCMGLHAVNAWLLIGVEDDDWPSMVGLGAFSTFIFCFAAPLVLACAVAAGRKDAQENIRPTKTKKLQRAGRKNSIVLSVLYENDHFAKTGSGQT